MTTRTRYRQITTGTIQKKAMEKTLKRYAQLKLAVRYGNIGCQAFKRGIQTKINKQTQ